LSLTGIITGFIIVVMLAFVPQAAQAQIGGSFAFPPTSWQSGAEAPRATARTRGNGGNVTTTTRLEEFDVPRERIRRPARASSRAARPARIVERKRTPRKVRVASLGNSVDLQVRRPVRRAAQRTRVASLGGAVPAVRAPSTSLTGGGIAWRASSGCLAGNLRSIVASLAVSHGSVTVNSTCRSARHNRRVGGARRSWHLTGNAVDFRIHGANIRRVYAYLRSNVGGLKHYGGGRFHIDNGPRRTF
jgi:hypothetical protein